MFIAALFVMAQNWKQAGYPLIGKWLNKHCISIMWDTAAAAAKSLQSCPTLRDPIDSSPPGSLIPGILQARTLEWVAIFFFNNESEK